MVTQNKRLLAAALTALALCWVTGAAVAQDAAAPAPAAAGDSAAAPAAGEKAADEKLAQTWENLIHYIRIAQEQAALSHGKALLAAGATPSEIYYLSARTPGSLAALVRGRQLKGMKEITDQLLKIIEQGYKTERSDPEQIRKAIELLGGTMRAYRRGRDRLVVSGEYAIPQLLRKLEEPEISNALREKIMTVLPQLGKEAVLPLTAALQTKSPQLRQIIANTLGLIEYPHAIPRLKEAYEQKGLQKETQRIFRAAIVLCAGGDEAVLNKPLAQLFYALAVKFYYRAESIVPDPRSETANVWFWDAELSALKYKPVPRAIFCDIYAMRMSRLALKHQPSYYPAVSLWLAANVKREIDLPKDAADPTSQDSDPAARFFLLAGGAKYQQDILARALKDHDWPVAVAVIEALGKTAGAGSLVEPVAGGAQPLVEALSSSNRVVRYWAAISLATALPKKRFTGSELVIPILAKSLGQTGKRTALVVAATQERRNVLKDAVRALGYEVMDSDDPAKGLSAVRAAGGVDVVVLSNDPDPMVGAGMIRRDPFLVSLPVVITAQTERFQALAKTDSRVRLVSPSASKEEIGTAVADAVKVAAGVPLTPEAAAAWAVRSAKAVRKLGLTNNAVYDIVRARRALIAALGDERTEVKVAAAEALGTMAGPEAQQAIADVAIDSSADEKIRISAFDALGESVRRFGNSLTDKQAQAIVEIVGKGSGEVRTSAAQILGALSLPSEMVKDLILEGAGSGR